MTNRTTYFSFSAALLSAVLTTAACTGRNDTVKNDRRAQGGGDRGTHERVSLKGCVQPAPAGQGFALRHVVMVPPAQQPQGQETMEHRLIPRGSWVRLEGGKDLGGYLGKEVTVMGEIVDPGVNTIGTMGQEKDLPRASVANGDAPRIGSVPRGLSGVTGGLSGGMVRSWRTVRPGSTRTPRGRRVS
jgi:hypothetical protein